MIQIKNIQTGELLLVNVILEDDGENAAMIDSKGKILSRWRNKPGKFIPDHFEVIDRDYKKKGRKQEYLSSKQYNISLPFELAMLAQEYSEGNMSGYIKNCIKKDLEEIGVLTKNNTVIEKKEQSYFDRIEKEDDQC